MSRAETNLHEPPPLSRAKQTILLLFRLMFFSQNFAISFRHFLRQALPVPGIVRSDMNGMELGVRFARTFINSFTSLVCVVWCGVAVFNRHLSQMNCQITRRLLNCATEEAFEWAKGKAHKYSQQIFTPKPRTATTQRSKHSLQSMHPKFMFTKCFLSNLPPKWLINFAPDWRQKTTTTTTSEGNFWPKSSLSLPLH